MKTGHLAGAVLLALLLPSFSSRAGDGIGTPGGKVSSWQAPGSWTSRGTLSDASGPMPFVPIAPCRVADTRAGSGFSGAYGAPAIGAGSSRTFNIPSSGCTGIPSSAAAFSFNFTVTNTAGPGFIQAYPAGGSAGATSAVNYSGAGQTVANAAVVPAGTAANAGKITVTAGVSTTDLIIDVNGYYGGAPSGGLGMALTSTNATTLTLNNLGPGGNGLSVLSSTTGYAVFASNSSTSCSGSCGGHFTISSTSASGSPDALSGVSYGTANLGYGVKGLSYGSGTSYTFSGLAAGVYGEGSSSAATLVAGVIGVTQSTDQHATGVYGEATKDSASGGTFVNSSGSFPVRTFLSYGGASGFNGLTTNGLIWGQLGLTITGGTKAFVTPHPEDPSKEIEYVAAEGPVSNVFFVGTGRMRGGVAVIPVPDHFRLVAREDSYVATITPVGEPGGLWVEAQGPEGIVVRGKESARFNYVVWGERDEFKGHEAVRPNRSFTPETLERTGALASYPASTKALLVRNGTLNEDGTYNRATAIRMGWTIPEKR